MRLKTEVTGCNIICCCGCFFTLLCLAAFSVQNQISIRSSSEQDLNAIWAVGGTKALVRGGASSWVSGGPTADFSAFSMLNGDVVMWALDVDNGKMWQGKNGTWSSGDPAAGTNANFSNIAMINWSPYFSTDNSGGDQTVTANVGATPFTYSVPTGFTGGVPA